MLRTKREILVLSIFLALAALSVEREAFAEWDYDNGFGYTGRALELRLNMFVQPAYTFLSDDGLGSRVNTFRLNLAGGRMRVWMARRRILAQVMGGVSGLDPVMLDSFVQIGIGRRLALRCGHFRVPFDEQTTHSPFWLRLTDKSIDVLELGHDYDLGVALQGRHLDNALVWAISVTNGTVPIWENGNIDFLYSMRMALRLGELLYWDRVDLIIGLGSSWNLEPWEPEPEVRVNQSVFAETLDLSLQIGAMSLTAALLYRLTDPGAYGVNSHALGWHFEAGVSLFEIIEVAGRVAHLVPDVGDQLADEQGQRMQVAAIINGFGDEGRLRFQLEYAYFATFENELRESSAHRVVAQIQAFY